MRPPRDRAQTPGKEAELLKARQEWKEPLQNRRKSHGIGGAGSSTES